MIKNVIIAILGLALALFIYLRIDTDSSLNLIDRDFQLEHAADRIKGVKKTNTIRLAMVISDDNYTAKESALGIEAAIDLINEDNGIKGKKLELVKQYTKGTMPKYLAAVQQFCTPDDIAVCIGPYISAFTPSVRALTQFESVPLVSPMVVYSEKLPRLTPDNFATFFPELDIWLAALLQQMKTRNFKNLLIISPKNNSYGDIFSTALQRYNNDHKAVEAIYRINFQQPLNTQLIQNSLVAHEAVGNIEAIFFAGDYDDYLRLKPALTEINMLVPIYTTEDLNVDGISTDDYLGELFVPTLKIKKGLAPSFAKRLKEKYHKELNFNLELSGMIIYTLKTELEQNEYDPIALSEALRKAAKDFYADKNGYSVDFITNKQK